MRWNNTDLTIVSWGRFTEVNTDDRLHRTFAAAHIKSLVDSGAKFCFVDFGSLPPLPAMEGIKRIESDYYMESVAKNHGLLTVETKLVAFTDWRTIISPRAVAITIEHLNQEGVPDHFIMQAFPWEMSIYHKEEILKDQNIASAYGEIIENMSIPHSAPRLPSGAWQVCLTEDAAAIRGWSEDVQVGCSADFHERMRAYAGWANGDNRGEILTRTVPVVVSSFRQASEIDVEQELSPQLDLFIRTSEVRSLGWRGL